MAAKVLPASKLQAWIDALVAAHEVFAPMEGDGASTFRKIDKGEAPTLASRTDISPKGIVFKQVEKILSYEKTDEGVDIIETPVEETVAVAFGVRPCDARAFALTDKVFVDSEMPEQAYAQRRARTGIVTSACDSACRTCFCTSIGGSPLEKTGDIWMLNLGDRYLVESLSQIGEKMLAKGEGLFTDATPEDEELAKSIGEKVAASMEKLSIPSAEALEGLFADEDFWKSLTEKCLSCGACTFVCPTCYCFDVRDEGNVQGGDRYRRWDSCMFYQYNRAAGGHNPRDVHWKRMRQRMLHKFCFYTEKYGEIDCVGCGRCIRSCPVSYDLRDFLKKAIASTGGVDVDFVDELPSEDDMPRTCDLKPAGDTTKTGVGADG